MTNSKTPAITIVNTTSSDNNKFTVLVPLSNPETESHLISLGATIAKQRDGTVVAINIEQVPNQASLEAARDQTEYEAAYHLLEKAKADAETYGVNVETHVILSHRAFEEVFDAAERYGADMTVMGWGPNSHGSPGRAETVIDDLAYSLPCDFVVFRDRGFDPSRVLLPTAGGPDSDLSAAIARVLREQYDAAVTLLHITEDREAGETFLRRWAAEYGLEDAELRVDAGNIQSRIAEAAVDATLVVIGATEKGLLSRLVRGSLVLGVLGEVECSVILAEKRHTRTFRERIFGAADRSQTAAETGVTTEATTPSPDHSEEDL